MMPPKALVFVNKTAQSESLSQSDGAERRQIFSHVQRRTVPCYPRVPDEDAFSGSAARVELKLGIPQAEIRGVETSEMQFADGWFIDPNEHLAATLSSHIPDAGLAKTLELDMYFTDGTGHVRSQPYLEPDAAAVSYMETVIQYYQDPQACAAFSTNAEIHESFKHAVASADADPAMRFALTCTISSSISLVSREKHHRDYSFYFKCLTLARLREQLNGQNPKEVPISTIWAISLLLWVHCIEGQNDEASFHVSALQQMLTQFSSIDQLPLSIATTVFGFPYLCSAMMRSQPIDLPGVTNTVTISSACNDGIETCARIHMPQIGLRFFESSSTDTLGPDLTALVSRDRRVRIFQTGSRQGALQANASDTQTIATESMRVSHAYVALPWTSQTGLTPLQNAVRIALFITSQSIVWIMGPTSAFCKAMAQQLRESLEASDLANLWAPNSELLLWALFVYAHCSTGPEAWDWATDNMQVVLSQRFRSQQNESIQEILEGFFYSTAEHQATLLRIREDVCARYGSYLTSFWQ